LHIFKTIAGQMLQAWRGLQSKMITSTNVIKHFPSPLNLQHVCLWQEFSMLVIHPQNQKEKVVQNPALLGNTWLGFRFKTGKETMVTLAGELVTKKKIITSTLDYVIAPQFGSRDHCYKTFSVHCQFSVAKNKREQ
jgi:hypothetical protein